MTLTRTRALIGKQTWLVLVTTALFAGFLGGLIAVLVLATAEPVETVKKDSNGKNSEITWKTLAANSQ